MKSRGAARKHGTQEGDNLGKPRSPSPAPTLSDKLDDVDPLLADNAESDNWADDAEPLEILSLYADIFQRCLPLHLGLNLSVAAMFVMLATTDCCFFKKELVASVSTSAVGSVGVRLAVHWWASPRSTAVQERAASVYGACQIFAYNVIALYLAIGSFFNPSYMHHQCDMSNVSMFWSLDHSLYAAVMCPTQLICGLMLPIVGVSWRIALPLAIPAQIMFAWTTSFLLRAVIEASPPQFGHIVLIHEVCKQGCFALGFGISLLLVTYLGGSYYSSLSAQRVVKRVEQLAVEKERLDFERRMALAMIDSNRDRGGARSSSGSTGISGSGSMPYVLGAGDPRNPPEQTADGSGSGGGTAPHSPTGVRRRKAMGSQGPKSSSGWSESTSGWEDLSVAIRQAVARDDDTDATSEQQTLVAPSTLPIASCRPIDSISTSSPPNPPSPPIPGGGSQLRPTAKPFVFPAAPAVPPAVPQAVPLAVPPTPRAPASAPEPTAHAWSTHEEQQLSRRMAQLKREVASAQKERKQMGLEPLPEEDPGTYPVHCDVCGGDHPLRVLLMRTPGKFRLKVIAGPVEGGAPGLLDGSVIKGHYHPPWGTSAD